MVWTGHIQSSHGPAPIVPFTLAQKRPNRTRFEITAMGQKSMRIFDGSQGWKVRARSDGSPDEQPFTPAEVAFARSAPGIDGELVDYLAKGSVVTLEGTETIEGNLAYRLNVRAASGQSHHVWIDARTYLEVKSDRRGNGPAGGAIAVYYRDYKEFDGLRIPTTIETGVGSGRGSDRMVIDRVVLNPPLDDGQFTRTGARGRPRGFARSLEPAQVPRVTMPFGGAGKDATSQ